jgi:hypothetical protein
MRLSVCPESGWMEGSREERRRCLPALWRGGAALWDAQGVSAVALAGRSAGVERAAGHPPGSPAPPAAADRPHHSHRDGARGLARGRGADRAQPRHPRRRRPAPWRARRRGERRAGPRPGALGGRGRRVPVVRPPKGGARRGGGRGRRALGQQERGAAGPVRRRPGERPGRRPLGRGGRDRDPRPSRRVGERRRRLGGGRGRGQAGRPGARVYRENPARAILKPTDRGRRTRW